MPVLPTPEVEPDLEHALGFTVAASGGDMADIFLHNDDVTPWEFVVSVLQAIFEFGLTQAERVTAQAHFRGIAFVITLPLEEAKYRVGRAHGLARAAGYPLALTIQS